MVLHSLSQIIFNSDHSVCPERRFASADYYHFSNPRDNHAVSLLMFPGTMDKFYREATLLGVDNLFKAPYTM